MKRFCYLIFTFIIHQATAQNLIPNGGFENNTYGQVSDWFQPVADYYHYESQLVRTEKSFYYNAVNGLCLLQPDPSEYLIAQLKKPLVKGKQYCVSFNVFAGSAYIGKMKSLKTIEMAFSDTLIDVSKRKKINTVPKLEFPIMDEEGQFFQPATIIYEADGTEKFIIIGKFHFAKNGLSIVERKQLIFNEWYQSGDSIKKYYNSLLPKPQVAVSKREIKRETQRLNDSISKLEYTKADALRANAQYYQQKVNNLMLIVDSQTYHVRVYLDNICLAPVKENNECNCEEKAENTFKTGQTYRLNNIQFDLDKAIFQPQSYAEMDNLVNILNEYPKLYIQLNGHTDSLNTEKYNIDLSNKRAKAVYDYVVQKGINPKRLKWKGFGESKPITSNSSEEGRAINRRVEFEILKTE